MTVAFEGVTGPADAIARPGGKRAFDEAAGRLLHPRRQANHRYL